MKLRKALYPFITTVIAIVLLIIFYGKLLINPNDYLFSTGGDGLKSYFGTYYHVKYDDDFLKTDLMNYPYGDFLFYSDSQPLISNTLKLLKYIGINAENNIIGIVNSMMLYSVVLGALILFLLLRRLKLPEIYSLIISIIIVFLSPQLDRMGGHFSLSYTFFIPLFLYLFHRLFTSFSYKNSLILGMVALICLLTHAYYFAFFAFISFFILLFYWIFNRKKISLLNVFAHLGLQIVLPFIIFSMLSYGFPTDRTGFPWGFFETRAFPESVFLPVDKPYAQFLHFKYLKWEGIAYVGLVATIGFLVLLYQFIAKRKKIIVESDSNQLFLIVALFASFIALLFSFTYPFYWNLEHLWNYMGPLRQFRASGRFSWLFFYVINIFVFYKIWHLFKQKKTVFVYGLLVVSMLWASYDAYLNVKSKAYFLNTKVSDVLDLENNKQENKWLNNFDANEFQAILPFPYFHVGSEAFWIEGSSKIKKTSFAASWKTGLPIHSVLLSRTSLSQTIKSLALYFEPLRDYEIVSDYPDNRDLLMIVQNKEKLNFNEIRIISKGIEIAVSDVYSVYRLPVDSLIKQNIDYRDNIICEVNSQKISFQNRDSNKFFIYESFGNIIPDNNREFVSKHNAAGNKIIFESQLFNDTNEVTISFWMNAMDKDLIARSTLKIGTAGSDGKLKQKKIKDVFKLVKYIDKNAWGLVEITYKPKECNEKLRLELNNIYITGSEIEIDDILIRDNNKNVYFYNEKFVYKNNRYIKR